MAAERKRSRSPRLPKEPAVASLQSYDLHDLRAHDPTLDKLASYAQEAAAKEAALLSESELGGPLPAKVLVTGSSGYLGSALVQTLRLRRMAVIGMDVRASATTDIVGSIADNALLQKAITGCRAVINTAALHAPHDSSHTEDDFRRSNVEGTASVLAAAKACGALVVHSSSTSLTISNAVRERERKDELVWLNEQSSPCDQSLQECDAPRNKYGRTKLEAERICLEAKENSLPIIVIRVSRFFPEDVLEKVSNPISTPNVKANELLGRRVSLVDVVDVHLRALARGSTLKYRKFTLCAPWPWSKESTPQSGRAVAAKICTQWPNAAELFEAQGWRLPDSITRAYDSSAAVAELGWKPRWTFDSLLARLASKDDVVKEDAVVGRY